MPQRNNTWANIDWITIFIYLILITLGWINIYAAVYSEEHRSIFDFSQRYGKQLIWILAGLFLAVLLLIFDSKFYVYFSYPFYGISLGLLALVLVVGKEVSGGKGWLELGAVSLQPAEFAKLTTAMALSHYISSYNFGSLRFRSATVIAGLILAPVAIIMLQNDTGSALVFLAFALPLYREGMPGIFLVLGVMAAVIFVLTLTTGSVTTIIVVTVLALVVYYFWRNMAETLKGAFVFALLATIAWGINRLAGLGQTTERLLLCAAGASGFVFIIYAMRKRFMQLLLYVGVYWVLVIMPVSVNYVFNDVMKPHQRERITELLGLSSNPKGVGYNVIQSKIAIGSGGWAGKGFLKGTQTKFNFVPEQSTDFIFCTIGEEWGFIGSTVVIIMFVWLMLRLIWLAERQRSTYSRVYGYCVASIFFIHFLINIGMTIGLMPVIGIPLPFISYGGSSLWTFTILLFIFLRLDASRFEKLSY
jgi:rod shape determining protein RodA